MLVIDDDVDTKYSSEWIKEALALERDSLPWLIVASPDGAWIGPLPDSVEKVISCIEGITPE